MAKRVAKLSKKPASKKTAKRALPKRAAKQAAGKKAPAKKPGNKSLPSASGGKYEAAKVPDGWITHTEFATPDPLALKAFSQKVFGWSFGQTMDMGPAGTYHLFAYGNMGGGGIMSTRPGEAPRVTPYITTQNVGALLKKALAAGAKHIMGPDTVAPGITLAVVEAPGGIMMGFSGPK